MPLESRTPDAERELVREARKAMRDRLKERLAEENAWDLHARLDKCGKPLVLICTSCGTRRHVETRCDLKWCPSCQYALAAATADRYRNIVTLAKWPLSVTMTARNYDYDDPSPIRQLRRSWGKMRRLRWFRRAVPGGVVGFEVTDNGKGYHVHAHGLFDCRWFAVAEPEPRMGLDKAGWKRKGKAAANEVAQQWTLCCGRPASMHVRRVWKRDEGDIGKALAETLKYGVKGSDIADGARPAAPLIRLLDGTRMITSFGTFFGTKEVRRIRNAPQPCDCGAVGCLMPEHIALGTARGEDGLTDRQRRR